MAVLLARHRDAEQLVGIELVVGVCGGVADIDLDPVHVAGEGVRRRVVVGYWRAIATRRRSSGVIRWSASSASSPRSICTQLTVPVKTLLSPS